jgi:catechol 2,3-dioxygenase-like lactoylglutathione lyase family enzyme
MSLPRLQHVSTPYPAGRQDDVRAFYGGVVGLKEKPLPDSLADQPLVWFEAGTGELELHFLVDDAGIDDGAARHFCLEVDDLDGCRRRLAEAGYEPRDTTPIRRRPRFFCRDPFGNLLEFTTIEGDYRET